MCFLVLHTTRMAQPALVYFCPIMLAVVVLSTYIRGGLGELRNLWDSVLPPVSDGGDHEVVFSLNGTNGTASGMPLSDTGVGVKIEGDGEKNDLILPEQHLNI